MDVFEAVEADLEERNMLGWANHNKPLLANDPARDWLQEAYEEMLDAAVYLKAALMRRSAQCSVPSAQARRSALVRMIGLPESEFAILRDFWLPLAGGIGLVAAAALAVGLVSRWL